MNELSTLLCTRAQNPISSHLKIPLLAILPSLSCIISFTLLIESFPSICKHAFISLIISKKKSFLHPSFPSDCCLTLLLPCTADPFENILYIYCHHFLIPCSLVNWLQCQAFTPAQQQNYKTTLSKVALHLSIAPCLDQFSVVSSLPTQ